MSTFLVAVGTFLTLLFAAFQIHELREEARIQHLFERLHEFQSPAFLAVRRGLAQKRMDTGQKRLAPLDVDNEPAEMDDALNFCVDLGLLTEHGALNRHDVWSEFGYWLFPIYSDARPYLDDLRKESPASFQECSTLVESIRPIEIREDASDLDHPSESDIYDFYVSEINPQPGRPSRSKIRSK